MCLKNESVSKSHRGCDRKSLTVPRVENTTDGANSSDKHDFEQARELFAYMDNDDFTASV